MFCFGNLQKQKSVLLAMAEHPNVLKKRIEFAKEKSGTRDRDALDTAVGFLPSPKGTSINIFGGGGAQPEKQEGEEDPTAVAPDVDAVFPMITAKQPDWQAQRQRVLQDKN